MTVPAFRPGRLLVPLLIAAFVLAACSPRVESAAPSPSASDVASLSSSPSAPASAAVPEASGAPAPGGDSVTGGESTPSASPSTSSATPTPDPTPAPAPAASPDPTDDPPVTPRPVAANDAEPFDMNLYRKGDFVAQYTFEWCVGASLQMALNMSTDKQYTTRANQETLWEMARDRSFSPFGGANPTGWTATLNELGIGPYVLVSIPTLDEALTVAAEAIRATERPVGLVMWRGRHAWMMSGFESTADPAKADAFEVTGIRVQDPLYPNGSSVWGPSPRPNSLVSPATLGKQFVVRDVTRSRVNLGVPSGYLMIVPVATEA
jgi:hypothetical protein